MNDSEPPKKPRGCLFQGCVVCLVMMLVVSVVGYLTVRTLANRVNAFITENTEAQPMSFPKVDMPADELKALQDRWAAFNAETNAATLNLTGREINALIGAGDGTQDLKNWFYFKVEGGEIRGQVSLPLESQFKIPLLHFKGRYLNGSGVFTVGITNEMFCLGIQSLSVKGKPLADKFMARLRSVNFVGDYNAGTNGAPRNQIESVIVTNGVIMIKRSGVR